MPVFNKMVYNGTEYILGGGGNIGEPLNLTVTTNGLDATITWEDNEIGTIPPTTFQKSELVRKIGSAPTSPSDGDLVVTETVKNTYKTSGYSDQGLTDGETYYYRVFSYSDLGGISYCDAVSVTVSSQWQPGVNTLLYLPLETDFDDYSQNHLSITNSGPVGLVSTGTGASIPVAEFDTPSTQLSFTNSYDINNTWTLNVWANITAQSTDALLLIAGSWSPMRIFHLGFTPNSSRGLTVSNGSVDVDSGSFDGRDGTWHLISITYSGTSGGSNNVKMYIDGVLNAQGTSTGRNLNTTTFMIGNYNQTATFGGYMSKFMLESTEWSAQEVSDYFNQTKGDYGIS